MSVLTPAKLIVQLNRMDESPDTAQKILDAAEHLFATKGFSATTIKQIAAESHQNSALIYYYYDSKATLYRHILERLVGRISGEAAARITHQSDPISVVRAVVESQVAVFAANPHLPALMARELIDWKAAHAEPAIRSLAAGLFDRLRLAVEEGQRAGLFETTINPRFAAISVIAQVGYLLLASPVSGILLGRGPDGPTADDVREFGRHAADFSLAALRARDGAVSSSAVSAKENDHS
jgi:AcrR family transcriptional regulator